MPKLSPARAGVPVPTELDLLSRGKIRDNYRLLNQKRLIIATDGISARDYVLNALIPMKGIFLDVLTVFWLKMLEQHGIKHHMVAYGAAIDQFLPAELRGDPDLQSRAMVVEDLLMDDAEFVVRGYLAGSALGPYQRTGEVCGHKLPPGYQDGDKLPCVLFTPTTKAKDGHDEDVLAEEIIRRYPMGSHLAVKVYEIGHSYAEPRGIIIPDTKFEFSGPILADEVLNPDSSRFWPKDEWLAGRNAEKRKAPSSFDKDPIRRWLDAEITKWQSEHGGVKMTPKNPEHVDAVHLFVMPDDLIRQTTQRNRYIFWRLTGKIMETYLRNNMGVNWPMRRAQKIAVLLGSRSDLPAIEKKIGLVNRNWAEITVHVMSCHRNPEETRAFALEGCKGMDAVICAGSKALQLPGILDAFANQNGEGVRVIGVALGEPGSKNLQDALCSIDGIPGMPVIMDELAGKPYEGPDGFSDAIDRVLKGELPPEKPRVSKPCEMNVLSN